jgi:hypothetical protein
MVQSTAIRETVEIDEGEALESALATWALMEVAETLPATAEATAEIAEARASFNKRLAALGWTDDFLRERLALSIADGTTPPSIQPPPQPGL